jgi:CRP/FNR family transcriptional regulator
MIKKLLSFLFVDANLKADADFLKKVALFSGLSDKALRNIALILFKKTYAAGEHIYKEKQEAEVLYLVKDGEVKISGSGNEKTIEQGGFFGEIALFKDRKHDSSAVAAKNCELYLVYRVKFDDMVEGDAKMGLKIMKNLSAIFSVRLKCVEI